MRVLFLAHRVPYPPNKGDKLRSFHQLRALVASGHEVHLVAFADTPRDLDHRATLNDLCASVEIVWLDQLRARLRAARGLWSRVPLSLGYFASGHMQQAVGRSLAALRFDALVVTASTMVQYVPRELSARTLVDLVDADSAKWRDYTRSVRRPMVWIYELEWRRLRRYEQIILKRFPHVVVSAQREAALLAWPPDPAHRARIHVITAGVDLEYFGSVAADKIAGVEGVRLRAGEGSPARLVFTGALDYWPNIDGVGFFAERVLPLIQRQVPRVEFWIVGACPTRQVKQLARQPGVVVAGSVEDIRPYFSMATVCVAPLRIARGVQNKILEAMASCRPVVATPEAAAGLPLVAGEHLLIGRDPRELAESVLRLLGDESLRLRVSGAGRRFVEQNYASAAETARFVRLVEAFAAPSAGETLSTAS